MADLREIVAINVRRLRHDKGWTQEDVAERVGLSVRYLGQIERAQASMTVTVLGRVADAFGVDAAELVKRPRSKQQSLLRVPCGRTHRDGEQRTRPAATDKHEVVKRYLYPDVALSGYTSEQV
jgi:transcriptional regulator with XRE-family HTH domain